MIKINNRHVDVNDLYGWAMFEKLSVNDFKWVEGIFDFNKDFMKAILIKVMKHIFLRLMFNILKI